MGDGQGKLRGLIKIKSLKKAGEQYKISEIFSLLLIRREIHEQH
jgi:hypothetical protein